MAGPDEQASARAGSEADALANTTLAATDLAPAAARPAEVDADDPTWQLPRPAPERGDPLLKELLLSQLFTSASSPPRIGRFTLLQRLGEGGMGTVYAAYDEHLDRKVAIKVLRTDAAPRRDVLRARLLREAKSMAQLSHPNVIAVHEAGEHEGQIFIAMEFVRGDSLDVWLRRSASTPAEPGAWRRVIAVFAQAGAGLVAAHQAGLIHRDFKPQNVMVSEAGAVKVLDFGLARAAPSERTRRSGEAPRELPQSAAPSLTATGTLLGTPAYMAPEQHLGDEADERSDQFSFCVALYEALYAQHPFGATSLAALREAVLAGRVREPPPTSPVPARIRRLLLRGLATRPEDRHPSLAGLLQALTHDPAHAYRRWSVVGGLVLAASAGTYALASGGAGAAPCSGVATEMAEVWSPQRQSAVASAIRATGLPYAEDTHRRVERSITAYAAEWTEMRARSCRAHHDALESDRLYDLRTACLARRRSAVDALVSLLVAATPGDVERATQAVSGLPPLATCADIEALSAALPPPDDPTVARAVEERRAALARAREYELLGRYDQARALIRPVIAAPEARAYAPLAAEAWLSLGAVELAAVNHEEATESLSRALEEGLRAGHLDVAAEAFARRLFTQGQTGETGEALQDVPLAQALVDRARDEQLRWLLQNNLGTLYLRASRPAEARASLLAALATKERSDGEAHREYAVTLGNLGDVTMMLGDLEAARDYQTRAIAATRRALGEQHPEVARMSFSLGAVEQMLGRYDAAHGRMQAALAQMSRAYGVRLRSLLASYLRLAQVSNARGDHHAALEAVARAAAALAEDPRADEPLAPYVHIHRAQSLAGLGRHEDASAELRRGLALVEAGAKRPHDAAAVHDALGQAALERGDIVASLQAYRRALALREETPGTPALVLAHAESRVAAALRAAGQHDAARDLSARALTRYLEAPQRYAPVLLAELRLGLGEALLDLGRGDEALAQLETAHRELGATCEPHNPTLARIEVALARAHLKRDPAEDRPRAESLLRGALASLRRGAPGFRRDVEAAEALLREHFQQSSARGN